ncbi:PREDICTED: maestro heat-like repeat family member 5 isoform X2 [Chinchilla lanigera]|uniref:maestro heat-like repeat family member 5 isoform X2 n=1 Tax=Chinchilla lanigera TaxID=34839 RepID=UPI0006969106|nr:PREDICTED: maestro heat-like repeat family member 5 isoform X2 [Chinchilla lanigera]
MSRNVWPQEEQELELDCRDLGLLGDVRECYSDPSVLERQLASRIRAMSTAQQGQALNIICRYLEGHTQQPPSGSQDLHIIGTLELPPGRAGRLEGVRAPVATPYQQPPGQQRVVDTDISVQKLLESLCLAPERATDKTLLFRLFGLILCECTDAVLVKKYLTSLLELSHQDFSQREDIALAVGLASTTHLEEVWALLEHLGNTWFLRWRNLCPEGQHPDANLHWKWVSSTVLLCYGQMAAHAKERILPWVDSITSWMVHYFSCSRSDTVLKVSFLSAAVLLTKVLRQDYGAQRYRFTQIPEIIQCLLWILQEEPNCLVTLSRQKIMLVIIGLSNLRPSLPPWVKSRVIKVCLRSVYALPPTEKLPSCLPSLDPFSSVDVMSIYNKTVQALDLLLQNFFAENPRMDEVCFLLQHMEHWLQSDNSHERRRAVQSILLLLQCVVDTLKSTEEAMPSVLGHQLGLLTLLWWDTDAETQSLAHQCVYLLLQLSVQQKGTMVCLRQSKVKCFKVRTSGKGEAELKHLVKVFSRHEPVWSCRPKAFDKVLSEDQHTQLVLMLLHGLSSHSLLQCHLASKLLLMIFEGRSIKPEQVAEVLQGLFQEVPSFHFKKTQQTMTRVMIALGTQYTSEVAEVLLSLCHPSEKQILTLWISLASNSKLARNVMTLLYMKLKLHPSLEIIQSTHQALGTIYELLYMQEYRAIVRKAFAGILLGLLTQLYYLLELGMVEGFLDYQEDILDSKPLGPCRTCLEALKGLFWTTRYWEVFAHIKLLRGWELFGHLETYTEGVTVLARAMALYGCEVKAVLGQAIVSMRSAEEQDNIVAILIISEFLNSPEVPKYVSQRTMKKLLSLGLKSPNWLVRAMSLKGFSSILMNPKKVALLHGMLRDLVYSFLQPQPQDPLGLIVILGDILHRLGLQGVGAISVQIAQHLLQLFEHGQQQEEEMQDPLENGWTILSWAGGRGTLQFLQKKVKVRGSAILLFGDVIYSGGGKFQQTLKNLAFQALVPLLLHLADSCQEVVMRTKFTFFRCAILLKWEFRKELFSKLAWGQGLSAEYDIFVFMVESNFGRHHQFFMQALTYLVSPYRNLKLAAMKFIDFDALQEDPDVICRRFYLSFSEDIMDLSQSVA